MQGGYFTAFNNVFDIGLNPYQFTVYMYLIRLSNNGSKAFPSYNTIAKKCNMSRPKVINVIKELEEMHLLKKEHRTEEGQNKSNNYVVAYPSKQDLPAVNEVDHLSKQRLPPVVNDVYQPSKQRLPNKELSINNKDYKELDKNSPSPSSIVKEIIDYLNEKAGKRFSYKSEANNKLINARLREGRTIGDFKHVIDIKCDEWLDDEKMNEYLRPATLFSQKNFENYVNQKPKRQQQSRQSDQRDRDVALAKWETDGYDPDDFRWNFEEDRPMTIQEVEELKARTAEFDQMLSKGSNN